MSFGVSNNNYSKIEKFNEWTNSSENYAKNQNGEKVEDFEMFNFNASTYSSDIKGFSQEYINKYDADQDKNWNYSEFVDMATEGKENGDLLSVADQLYSLHKDAYEENVIGKFDKDGDKGLNFFEFLDSQNFFSFKGFGIKKFFQLKNAFEGINTQKEPENKKQVLDADELLLATTPDIEGIDTETLKQQSDLHKEMKKQFETFNFDSNAESINAGEVASVLYSSDLDLENYAATGDIASSVDGKLDYINYQTFPMFEKGSDGYNTIQRERSDFYNNFYAE